MPWLLLTVFHVLPRSSLRQSVPSADSMSAYTRAGLLGANATAMRPAVPDGKPLPLKRVQCKPPSLDSYTPSFGPPLFKWYGERQPSHMPARRCCGLEGSIATLEPPVRSSVYNTRCHAFPPSVVR